MGNKGDLRRLDDLANAIQDLGILATCPALVCLSQLRQLVHQRIVDTTQIPW